MAIVTKGSGGSIKFSGTGGGISITSSGGGGGGGFDPSSLGNLSAWYDAEDLAVANGSNVTSWSDKSGNGNNLSLFTQGGNPTLDSTGTNFNGKKAVNFSHEGNGRFALMCTKTAGTTNIPTGTEAKSMYAVFKAALIGPYGYHPVVSVGDTYQRVHIMGAYDSVGSGGYSSVSPAWWTFGEAAGGGQLSDVYSASTNTRIASFIIDNGQQMKDSEFLINGSTSEKIIDDWNATQLATLPSSPNNVEIVIGGLAGETSYMGYNQNIAYAYEGKIAEVIIYRAKHTNSERLQVTQYLASKYGISI